MEGYSIVTVVHFAGGCKKISAASGRILYRAKEKGVTGAWCAEKFVTGELKTKKDATPS